ncbi:hypothetical protein SShM2_004 [Synechococcus phage S-ShM2]|uniref:Uncharacterized protein n=1 Tax=Synechococcus phage S-ShM2 TaxID=445683 RepID=E3SJQ5_9CAUD|nr:hypothetical protein SShM2_004 [Synechococcus phage S-ShM2]ADO97615.1 hypothetical protein SShM2_004 [Synechococcus phage S-ShM2]
MKKVLLLIAGAAFFAAPVQAHQAHKHRNHHHHYNNVERYFTCHDHLRRNIRHCHGHTNWGHGRQLRRRDYFAPSIIFDF